jgi:hypothetical protein
MICYNYFELFDRNDYWIVLASPKKDGKKKLKESMRKHYQLSTCLPVGIDIVLPWSTSA